MAGPLDEKWVPKSGPRIGAPKLTDPRSVQKRLREKFKRQIETGTTEEKWTGIFAMSIKEGRENPPSLTKFKTEEELEPINYRAVQDLLTEVDEFVGHGSSLTKGLESLAAAIIIKKPGLSIAKAGRIQSGLAEGSDVAMQMLQSSDRLQRGRKFNSTRSINKKGILG